MSQSVPYAPNRHTRPATDTRARFLALLALTLLALTLVAGPANAGVEIISATDEGLVGQPFELVIEAVQFQSVTGSPDLTPLKQDFRIHSSRSVYLTQKRTGRTVYVSRWILSLSPIRAGALMIPAIQIKGEWSQPLAFQAHPKPRPKAPPLQLKTSLSSVDALQGQSLSLSVQLFYNIALRSAELTQPQLDQVRILRQGAQRSYTRMINRKRYQVIEQRYWVQALKPGRFQIPALQFTAIDSQGETLTGQSPPLEFTINPLPDDRSSQVQLLATKVQLRQRQQPTAKTLRAGDTLTRSITIEAQGVPAQWLPDIQLAPVEGISVYPQPATLEQIDNNDIVTSRKQIDFKLLLTQSGSFELPAITLDWWDIANDRAATARLASMQLQVAPFNALPDTDSTLAANVIDPAKLTDSSTQFSSSNKTRPKQAHTDGVKSSNSGVPWQAWVWALIAVICAGGWTLSRQRNKKLEAELARQNPSQPQTSTAITTTEHAPLNRSSTVPSSRPELYNSFQELAEACHLNDPELAFERLLDWAAVHWPHAQIESLHDIQQLAKDPTLTYLLKNLEHQFTDPSDSWHGDLLLERIERLRQQSQRPPKQRMPQPPSEHTEPRSKPSRRRVPLHTTVGD